MRTIILHYHLFKNAGTSLDDILLKNFGSAWVTREFSQGPAGNGAQVAEWIRSTPDAVAFSSHTMSGVLPEIEDVRVIPVIFLRDPIARIRSAYDFERQQNADTVGTRLAAHLDFEGYVQSRLAIQGDRQCRDFHLAALSRISPGRQSELERAKATITRFSATGVVGLVEEFNRSLERLAAVLTPIWPEFSWQDTRANSAKPDERTPIAAELDAQLRDMNAGDLSLLHWARERQVA